MLKQVLEAYPTQVRFVYKHFPLPMHANARPAAEAALFARKHGKFWEMHELIFQNFSQLTLENLKKFGAQVGLDPEALGASVTQQAFKAEIDRDMADARKAMVNSTPSIFVNGRRLQNRTFEEFKRMIDAALAAQEAGKAAAR